MPRKQLLSAWIVTALLAGGILWQVLAGGDTPPTPAPPTDGPNPAAAEPATAEDGARDGQQTEGALAPAGGESIVRVEVAGNDGSGECVLELSVRVEQDGRRRPAPFVDCRLRLLGEPPFDVFARTDARGMAFFTFTGGDGRSVAATSGLGGNAVAVLAAGNRVPLTVTVPARAVAAGRVVDATGGAVAGADIVLLHWPRDDADVADPWRVGRSDEHGRFRIPVAVGGRIAAQHDVFGASPMFLLRTTRPPAQPLAQTFELVLPGEAGAVAGIVRDPFGHVVADAEVSLRRSAPAKDAELAAPPRLVRTGKDGRFLLRALSPGTMQWVARATGFGWQRGTIRVSAGRPATLIIDLPAAAVVTGTVRDHPGGPAVAGAVVTTGQPGDLDYRAASTAADGSFALTDLGTGVLEMAARAGSRTVRHTLDLRPGGVATWDPVLSAAAVTPELNGEIVDHENRPLAGWRIVVRQPDQDPIATESDEGGAFLLPVRRVEGLDVRAFAPGRLPTAFADVLLRNVAVTASPLRIVVPQRQLGSLHGQIVDSAYRGVAATIEVWHDGRREHARFTADEGGRLDIPQVPEGSVYVTVRLPDHVDHLTGPLPVQAGLATDLGTIVLALAGGLHGTLRDALGQPPTDCRLQLILAGSGRILAAERNADGYRFTGVPAGTHRLVVQGDGIAGEAQAVRIDAGISR
ncbi:MAG TPA: carboxypeptidase regulatory-like domain-containing protein, partial [bacterium]|nr:carboxypeptidase regulatory-like domain-containing protein [bacterium]